MFNYKKRKRIKEYNSFRKKSVDSAFCFAPFSSIRFHRNGGVQVCCHHLDFLFLQDKSLKEIWFGPELEEMRNQMKSYDIPKSCSFCSAPFYDDNFSNVNAVSFDRDEPTEKGYPLLLDFSLKNTCNLECIMCDASLSSAIAKSKSCDVSVNQYEYNDEFVEQLTEFIPHLKYSIFTGGEPFLIQSYYSIWEKMIDINPKILISLTTNGTIYNSKIADILSRGDFNITVSLDSLVPEIYNKIRIGAELETTLENVGKFSHYCKEKGTVFSITVCPMQINRFDIPEIVNKCNSENWGFSYNTVLKPWTQALWSLPSMEMLELLDYYKSQKIDPSSSISAKDNISKYNSLILLLEDWLIKIKGFEANPKSEDTVNKLRRKLVETFKEKMDTSVDNESQILIDSKINEIIIQIPNVLISDEFLNYLINFDSKTLRFELDEYDIDTIVDHMCIVAFNL